MKITIVGSGYVGLVTGACFAEVGIDVTCVDIDVKKIEKLKNGVSPIFEPGLDEMLERNIARGKLNFTTDLAANVNESEVVFSAVGTPPDEDGSADLKYVLDVARTVGEHMNKHMIIVTKSTVPVGTAKKVRIAIQEALDKRGENITFDVVSNPEFLKEGAAIDDFMKPDRIVVGIETDRAKEVMTRLYRPFTLNNHPVIFMDVPSAEMTKYAANAMLATRISFMNDIANLCELVGANVNMVRRGIGSDSRIGSKFLYSGIGYGGSCFPKDVKALIKTGEENNYKLRIIQSVEDVNEDQKSILFDKLKNYFGGKLEGLNIAMWGLSFKPQTDDMREAPSLVLIDKLISAGCKVKAYDPAAMEEAQRRIGDVIEYAKDPLDALLDVDALMIVTEWIEFRFPNYKVMQKLMTKHVIFDGRNIYDPSEVKEAGFDYFCIGLKTGEAT
jgi:UDPglucose 6-dehydrogenase